MGVVGVELVTVRGMYSRGADLQWREPDALKLAHPRYFGYDVDYVPVEERFGS